MLGMNAKVGENSGAVYEIRILLPMKLKNMHERSKGRVVETDGWEAVYLRRRLGGDISLCPR